MQEKNLLKITFSRQLKPMPFIKKNIVNDISPNCPPCDTEECETYEGDGGFVLELPANTCRSLGIKIGDRVDYQ